MTMDRNILTLSTDDSEIVVSIPAGLVYDHHDFKYRFIPNSEHRLSAFEDNTIYIPVMLVSQSTKNRLLTNYYNSKYTSDDGCFLIKGHDSFNLIVASSGNELDVCEDSDRYFVVGSDYILAVSFYNSSDRTDISDDDDFSENNGWLSNLIKRFRI